MYGEADPALTAAVTGAVDGDKIEYTLSRAAGENVGEYAITVNLGENPNYDVTATDSKLTVGKKAATVTADDKSKTEGEADPALTATVTDTVGRDQLKYTLSRDKGEEAGEYTIHVSLGNNPNYSVSAVNGVFTVIAAAKPETQEPAVVTVPVSSDEATTNVTVTVEETVATVADASIDEVLSAQEVGTVTVDMSALETEITEVVIPNAMLTKIADAVADEESSADGLEIKLTEGTIHLNAEAVAALKEQAGDRDLHLKLDAVQAEELNQAQQEAIKDMETLAMYEAYILVDGQRVEISGDSKVTAAVKVELTEGQTESGVRIFAVNEAGEMTEVPVTWEDGEAKFEMDSFSKYVVTYDAAK